MFLLGREISWEKRNRDEKTKSFFFFKRWTDW